MASTTAETKDTNSCAYCGTHENNDTKLKTCNACKMVRYCSRDCQVSHWPQHKEACKKHAELFEKELFKDPPEREECPICMLPYSFDTDCSSICGCCGTSICNGCLHAQFKEDVNNGKEFDDCLACAFCRSPAPYSYDKNEVINMLNRIVERNNAPLIHYLAVSYVLGENGLEKDLKKSIKLFEQAGKLGYADSYTWLGNIYDGKNYEVESDMKRARHYYELGTIGGSIYARNSLAHLEWHNGNPKRAFKHYLICAKAGMDVSLEAVKDGFEEGFISKDEYAEALRAFQKQHEDSRSETRDQAFGYYLTSREEWERYYHYLRYMRGDHPSLYQFACLDWNNGNYVFACEAFLLSAEAGFEPALEKLKTCVEKGYITKDDYAKACRAHQKQHTGTRSQASVVRLVDAKSKATI